MDLIALPVRGQNIAPIFDFSPWFVLCQKMGTEEKTNAKIHIQNLSSVEKARVLLCAGVKTVICGCISESLEKKLVRSGIRVIWGITGPVTKVLESFQTGQLEDSPYRVLSPKFKRIRTQDFFPLSR